MADLKQLNKTEAKHIHDLIMNGDNVDLIDSLEQALKANAGMRVGLHMMPIVWSGTDIPPLLQQQLASEFGFEFLVERNLVSADGSKIELNVLAGALSDEIVLPHLEHDPEAIAEEQGVDFEEFKQNLKSLFKGTVGRPGQSDFAVLLEANKQMREYTAILGLGMLVNPWDKETSEKAFAQAEAGEELPSWALNDAKIGRAVAEKGLDPRSVYVVLPEISARAVELLAEYVNFPGASHYLPKGQQR